MIGGFLGAGKTTAIARLARGLLRSGLKVGLVTNDQAYDLVDTRSLRAQGFHVGEVPGACFCCKFDDLVETVRQLSLAERPDVLLAEPVGSCTDLAATVLEPLAELHGARYELGPLVVLLKPEHGRKILDGQNSSGFSPQAAYIFLKQIEEADVVVVNKIDKITRPDQAALIELVQRRFPNKTVLAASAKTGLGFDQVEQLILGAPRRRGPTVQVDYDTYAQGEAELGWYNATVSIAARDRATPFQLDSILTELATRICHELKRIAAEPAHLKILGTGAGASGVANLVSSQAPVELSRASHASLHQADLVVNARVATTPDALAGAIERSLAATGATHHLHVARENTQCFRPARPVPTHRIVPADD